MRTLQEQSELPSDTMTTKLGNQLVSPESHTENEVGEIVLRWCPDRCLVW
jgi:hypothetical protein